MVILVIRREFKLDDEAALLGRISFVSGERKPSWRLNGKRHNAYFRWSLRTLKKE